MLHLGHLRLNGECIWHALRLHPLRGHRTLHVPARAHWLLLEA